MQRYQGPRGQGVRVHSPPVHSVARSRRATPATPHTSVWKHMPTTVLRGAPSQATSSVYRSSGHPAHELLLMWARWLCGSGSALMWAHPRTAPNPCSPSAQYLSQVLLLNKFYTGNLIVQHADIPFHVSLCSILHHVCLMAFQAALCSLPTPRKTCFLNFEFYVKELRIFDLKIGFYAKLHS